MERNKIPTATNVHHVGVTVPDLDEAVGFFVECVGAELLYRKGPFGDPGGDSMERRLGVHPDATASLAMLRCGPTTNLELFEWDAPDQREDVSPISDVGATHIGIQVGDIETATDALAEHEDVKLLDGPHTNEDGPTEGLTYVFCRTPWGMFLELVETPDYAMPYADDADGYLYGPAPSWEYRPENEEEGKRENER
ncbi:MAG: VOC family protein [Halobacteriales archaeon]|nr:VOC family protein [Halobacteriales archaeon]